MKIDRADTPKARGGRAPRGPKKVSEAYLERAALHYLGRFSSTEANLRAVLERKIKRRTMENAPPTDEQRGWIDTVVAKCVRYGYVDDAAYARQRVEMLVRRGKPTRMITQDLRYKGVPEAIATAALREFDAEADEDADRQAAAAYVRRRRFGAFRRADRNTEDKLEKEKAAMMRAGFSYSLVKDMLEASEDELMAMLP
ncbi:MAG: RecX family transcriptional regulator [Alphaproteobacteria bacterium]|nr:RecX family transcriptional regulator [Alphaproteobacteria bacterium]